MKDENGLIFNNNYEQVVKKMGRDRRLKRDRGDYRRKDDESCRQLMRMELIIICQMASVVSSIVTPVSRSLVTTGHRISTYLKAGCLSVIIRSYLVQTASRIPRN